jgi:superfamily II DNA or RNA helicase
MVKLEDIAKDSHIHGIENEEVVRIVSVEPIGNDALTVYYKNSKGRTNEQMLFRSDEGRLEMAKAGRPWAFDAPAADFKLCVEAYRIHLAHLFDPMMAVHTSNVVPLPHQISAVYESMLPRQPLRYVLADDPGAGKTIMAGLLIREMVMRADAKRILIVAPGSLVEQWQDELFEKFGLEFTVFSRELDESSLSGNAFLENDQLVARLDQLSRSDELQEKLTHSDWDLIICDEAHKMSATYFGQKLKETKRFKLGKLLGSISRHFLLMTATPHNGKEEDFQLFLSLLDSDRFYGKFREGAHRVDVSDMMRRMVKEELLKFDGTPLFPERRAYTANYELSDFEAKLYADVTDYVRNEMNRADQLDGKRRNTIGFALTQLQRRLASSPEAIFQSIKRRRRKLEARLEDEKLVQRGHKVAETLEKYDLDIPENLDEAQDELSGDEYEDWAEQVVDQATASQSIQELEAEIITLKDLEFQAKQVVHSGKDKKWEELSGLLQDNPEMFTASRSRRKMIIFTEHKDTLNYLRERIGGLLGVPEAVVVIHGGINRDHRRKTQEEFRNNPDVIILLATDAAGEGVNLQNANLMVNYDLPWNPNRLEQRFGRIHRIGQEEVCHLWNLVAKGTREGEVFIRLFEKMEVAKIALGGRVFDVLGEAFENVSLKEMLIEAIRYGEQPETRARLNQAIEGALDANHLKDIMKRNVLCEEHMSLEQLYSVKEEMEKAEARKLQPFFIRTFFTEAFHNLDGQMRSREAGRYEIKYVPASIRERDRVIGETRTPVLRKYERVCFEKQGVRATGKPMADLIHPAHPLMSSITDLILGMHRSKLKQGTILIDPNDEGAEPKVLFLIDHTVRESAGDNPRVVSRRLQFVGVYEDGHAENAGWAPHLDLQLLEDADHKLVSNILASPWLTSNLEGLALDHAVRKLVPEHYGEVRARRENHIDKTHAAVKERLVKEINYWSDRWIKLTEDVKAGKQPRMQPDNAKKRYEELTARLEQRKKELSTMRHVVSSTPVVVGGVLVIPQGLLSQLKGDTSITVDVEARSHVEKVAMDAVIATEESMGNKVVDVSAENCGWDLTARLPLADGKMVEDRHIEVKGRSKGQTTITVSRNEIIMGMNQQDKFYLAIVIVDGDSHDGPFYIQNPFNQEPEFGVASINYQLSDLLSRATNPIKTI